MDKMDGSSLDILEENIQKIKQLFPEVFTEKKIDFEKLQEVLGAYTEGKEERYSFNWNGKSKALRLSQTPSTGTLRPVKEDSKNWDTTENLYIEGDNLEVLKLLQKTYHNKVKMIYIDPPYNTGKDFVYPDDYRDNIKNYLELTGQMDDTGKKIGTNSEASGRYHTDWLNMIYPRLRLARNLLSDDGVIFISIDDNEVHNLRKICDEIFGEDNTIACLVWERAFAPKNDANYISNSHDYILVIAKDIVQFEIGKLERTEEANQRYKNLDNDSRGVWASDNLTVKTYSQAYDYEIITPSGIRVKPTDGRCWVTSKDRMNELIKDNRIWFGADGNNTPRLKRFLSDVQDGMVPISIWYNKDVGHNQEGRQELKKLFDDKGYFDGPKPIRLMRRIFTVANTSKDSIILDFFAGSSTTAHAVMQFNAEDGGNRKFIMVQLPEPTDENSEANKAGYKNICDIGKERIRRAGEKIIVEYKDKEGIENLDIGFKLFKLDSSNIKEWNPDYDNLDITLDDMVNNFVPNRSEDDILYEIMLKYGINLSVPIDEYMVDDKKLYSIGLGMLFVCLDNNITINVVEGIIKKAEELNPERKPRVVLKDNGFKDDSVKTNTLLTLKRNGIEEVVSI